MYGFLADKKNPVSMEEMVQEIKRDRRESDAHREAVFDKIVEKSRSAKKFSTRFSRQLESLGIKE